MYIIGFTMTVQVIEFLSILALKLPNIV